MLSGIFFARPSRSVYPIAPRFPDHPIVSRLSSIRSGDAGNYQTVSSMRWFARGGRLQGRAEGKAHRGALDPVVRYCAVSLTMHVPHDQPDYQIDAIRGYLATIPFIADPYDDELVFEPGLVIRDHAQGLARVDCDDIATLGAALCRSIGLRTRFEMRAFFDNRSPFSHILAYAAGPDPDDVWHDLDTTRPAQVAPDWGVARSQMLSAG
jgi:transglutaminase-like putative cysteine protease